MIQQTALGELFKVLSIKQAKCQRQAHVLISMKHYTQTQKSENTGHSDCQPKTIQERSGPISGIKIPSQNDKITAQPEITMKIDRLSKELSIR